MMHSAGVPSLPVGSGTLELGRVSDADGVPWESSVDDAICSAAVTPDSSLLAVGSEGGEILLRRLDAGARSEQRLAGHSGGTMALSWVAPPRAAVGGHDGWAKQAHAAYVSGAGAHAKSAARYAALCESYGVRTPVAEVEVDAQPFGCWVLVSSGADGHVRAWDGATGRLLCAQPCRVDGASRTGGVSGAAGAWVMNVDSRYTTVGGLPAIRYLATVGKHVLSGVLVPEPQPSGMYADQSLEPQPADAEVLGPLDKTVDCASFCSDGSIAACCYGGVAVWRPRDDRGRRESDRVAPRKFSYKGWLVRLAPSPGNHS